MMNVPCVAWVIWTNNVLENWHRAFVLHRREYSESSLLVDFFTEDQGRISLLAKGVRRPRSPLKSVLQPFTPLMIQWAGKGELKVLTKVGDHHTLALPLETKALYSGFYVNEILMRVLEKQTAYHELFQAYRHCLERLAIDGKTIEPTLRRFEFQLLKALGYGVDFEHCMATGLPVDANMLYQFRENEGFIASLLQNNLSFEGSALLAFAALDFHDKAVLQAAKRFTRIALKPYLGSAPLKSRELFQAILPARLKGA